MAPILKEDAPDWLLLEDDCDAVLKEPLDTDFPLETEEEADFPVTNEVMDRLNRPLDIKIYLIRKCLSRNHGGLCGCPLYYQPGGSC